MTQPTMSPPSNALALAGFILGLASAAMVLLSSITSHSIWYLSFLPATAAFVFGFVGITTANRLQGKRRGIAIAAVILGLSPLLLPFLVSALFGVSLV